MQLVKKATCSSVDVQEGGQYLVMGAHGSVVKLGPDDYKSVSLYHSLSPAATAP